ncbi:hypothetical protein BHM03_00027862 [Ensete ventricosum]|nr:hypothetical protein BHM03_00027862 [Ensete ventricosum]
MVAASSLTHWADPSLDPSPFAFASMSMQLSSDECVVDLCGSQHRPKAKIVGVLVTPPATASVPTLPLATLSPLGNYVDADANAKGEGLRLGSAYWASSKVATIFTVTFSGRFGGGERRCCDQLTGLLFLSTSYFSGCITSAETIMLEKQSLDEFLAHINYGDTVVVSISSQSRASLAAYFDLSPSQVLILFNAFILHLFSRHP